MEMEEGVVFAQQQDQQDALAMLPHFDFPTSSFRKRWIHFSTINRRAMICPLPRVEQWSSILHTVIVLQSDENLRFACQWLRQLNVDIGEHTYPYKVAAPCSLLFVASRPSTMLRYEKVTILLEFGATFPERELEDCSWDQWNCYQHCKNVVDKKRDRVARSTLVILSMHRLAVHSMFRQAGRDMTRLIAQEVFHSGIYLWPDQ